MRKWAAVLLVIAGVALAISGSVFAVAFHDYMVFSLPIIPSSDLAMSVGVAFVGVVLLSWGTRGLIHIRRRHPTL